MSRGRAACPSRSRAPNSRAPAPSGQILFNVKKGRVEKSTTTLELKGELSIEIGGQTTKVELSQVQDSTVDTLDTDPTKKS